MPSTQKNDVKSSASSTTSADEKARISEVERAEAPAAEQSKLYNPHVDVSGVDERKLMRKLDWWLVPWLSFLYLLSFLDRTSIGNARLYGLETSLHINDNQYNIALTVFFFSYALFEVPSNIFLKRLRPSIWLSLLMLLWGIMMTVQGLVHNYGGLLGMRWMLGLFEAGLFPGVNYYLSCWYRRSEFGIRAAVFFSAATVSGAFGGLLAAAISKMDGIGGKPGWAWIFILEGLITVVAGAASFWIIQDFPDTAKFLTEEERTVVIRRLQKDDQFSAAGESLKLKYIWQSLKDWKTWVGMLLYMGTDGPLYAFSLFLPSIINQLGFTATPANLLTVPVYALACVVTCVVGFVADRYGQRGLINMYAAHRPPTRVRLTPRAQRVLARRPRRLHHPDRVAQRDAVVHRRVPRGVRHLPEHPEHHRVGVEQRRGLLQAQRHARDGDQLREPQRRGLLQRLPRPGQALVHARPRHRADVHRHRAHLRGRLPLAAQARERAARPRRARRGHRGRERGPRGPRAQRSLRERRRREAREGRRVERVPLHALNDLSRPAEI